MENILKELRAMLQNHPDVHKDSIMVHFDEFQDSSLSLFCYFFTNTTVWAEYLSVREDINLKMMKIVEQNGAGFAFPSQSIYVESMPKNEMI
jgi:MscS family membrane protein